jgi:hypothetical protein
MKKRNKLYLLAIIIMISIFLLFFALHGFNISGFVIFDSLIFRPMYVISSLGRVLLDITFLINIESPQNTTYNFNRSNNFTMYLNVSSNRNVSFWYYTLKDLTSNIIINNSVSFTPNTTFYAVKFSNQLIIFANDSSGNFRNNSIVFYINASGSSPVITNLNQNILVCEGDGISHINYLSEFFNATDSDDSDIIYANINPNILFYVTNTESSRFNLTLRIFEIFSGQLGKEQAGGVNAGFKLYSRNVSVNDGLYTDSKSVNITVIETNHKPVMENIGVQTVWVGGDNFYYEVDVADTEDGNSDSGNLSFNLSFSGSKLFNISSKGIINFTPVSGQIGVHNVSVCSTDDGIRNPHQNISFCNQDGSNLTACKNFSLTITNLNRAPNITSHYPFNLTLTAYGSDSLYFNVSLNDPDGTIPDVYWTINDVLEEYDSGSLTQNFQHAFGCGISGNYSIKARATDGSLNSSVQWNITVLLAGCPAPVAPGGGGAGGGVSSILFCKEKWGCSDWSECGNLREYSRLGKINVFLSALIKERCSILKWNDEICGFQTRNCTDFNSCRTNQSNPGIISECYFVLYPNCMDGIKNCHDGACEILTDCGGPCLPCPTCSDEIKNQDEEGIDCGGPCKSCPEKPLPLLFLLIDNIYLLLFLLLFLIGIILIAILLIKRYLFAKEVKK